MVETSTLPGNAASNPSQKPGLQTLPAFLIEQYPEPFLENIERYRGVVADGHPVRVCLGAGASAMVSTEEELFKLAPSLYKSYQWQQALIAQAAPAHSNDSSGFELRPLFSGEQCALTGTMLFTSSSSEQRTVSMDESNESNNNKGNTAAQISKMAPESGVEPWEIPITDIQIAFDSKGNPVELGQGSFGTIYRGTLRGVQPAAIKVVSEAAGTTEAAFDLEAAIMKHINRDRNIVQLYGTSKLPDGRLCLVTELMEGGDLRAALSDPRRSKAFKWNMAGKSVALDIARGLTAMHAVNVIHRDLKSKNVLLNETLTAKIADVGIAAVHSKGYLTESAGGVMGTFAWSAPELLLNLRCTEKVDIYSLGVVLFEIATGDVPQRGFLDMPKPSPECPAALIELIGDCIKYEPQERPTAKEVYDRIFNM